MKVLPSHTGEVTAAAAAATPATTNAPTSGASFASVLAKESTATAPGTDVAATPPAIALGKHETMTPVTGHAYAEISGGKRDGLYVNTSHNKRHGQAFVLVHKHGREYHIYGHGKNRVVVCLRKREPTPETTTTATAPSPAAAGTGGASPTVSAT